MERAISSLSSAQLRRQIFACHELEAGERGSAEQTWSAAPSVVYAADDEGGHGNFLRASYRRICARPEWRRRLEKRYTADARLPRTDDRRRGELECANSSDALLMNVFCYPRVLHRVGVCALLGVERGVEPRFGVRAGLEMRGGEVDRTEIDLCAGDLAVEAKLTEGGFGTAPRQRVLRYCALDAVFDVEALPWRRGVLVGYQLVRGVLAAEQHGCRFALLCDGRRADLRETWFSVLRAVRRADVRSRMALLCWQEVAATMPPVVQGFMASRYGILPA